MLDLDQAQIKADFATARDARRRYSNLLRDSGTSLRAQLLANRRSYFERLLASYLTHDRYDVDNFEKLRSQSETEIRRLLQQQREAVVKLSSSVRDTLHSDAASWRKTTEHLISRRETITHREAPPSPAIVFLDTPISVYASSGLDMPSTNVQPGNTSAKLTGEWNSPYPANGSDYLAFYFVWANPSGQDALVNVSSSVILNGFSSAYAGGGLLAENEAEIVLDADLFIQVYPGGGAPPYESEAHQVVAGLTADVTGTFFSTGDYESSGINGSYGVSYSELIVPGNGGTVGFEVDLDVFHWIYGDGSALVDFNQGDFEVVCPGVRLQILT